MFHPYASAGPSTIIGRAQPDRLLRFRKTLAQSERTVLAGDPVPTTIAIIGDSVSEGYNALTTDPTATRPHRWADVLSDEIHRRLGRSDVRSVGTRPPGAGAVHAPLWTVGAGAPATVNTGFGKRGRRLVPGDRLDITVTARRVLIAYRLENLAPAATQLEIRDGASLLDTIDPQSGAYSLGAGADVGLWDSGDLGANTSRTFTVTGVGPAGGARFINAYFMGDDQGEIMTWNGGFSGESLASWIANLDALDFLTALDTIDLTGPRGWLGAVITFLGLNQPGTTPRHYYDNLLALDAAVQARTTASTPSRIWLFPFLFAARTEANWRPYRDAMLFAADRCGAAVFDTWEALGDYGMSFDTVHPEEEGHWLLGYLLASFLMEAR